MDNIKIYKVSCTLQPNKFDTTVTELEVKESPRSYILNKVKQDSVLGKKYIKKGDLLKVNSGLLNEHIYNLVFYTTYCLENDIEQAKAKVEVKVLQEFNRMNVAMQQMSKRIEESNY